jgi:hypothetical protein
MKWHSVKGNLMWRQPATIKIRESLLWLSGLEGKATERPHISFNINIQHYEKNI